MTMGIEKKKRKEKKSVPGSMDWRQPAVLDGQAPSGHPPPAPRRTAAHAASAHSDPGAQNWPSLPNGTPAGRVKISMGGTEKRQPRGLMVKGLVLESEGCNADSNLM